MVNTKVQKVGARKAQSSNRSTRYRQIKEDINQPVADTRVLNVGAKKGTHPNPHAPSYTVLLPLRQRILTGLCICLCLSIFKLRYIFCCIRRKGTLLPYSILQYFEIKLCNIPNFKMHFLAVNAVMDFVPLVINFVHGLRFSVFWEWSII